MESEQMEFGDLDANGDKAFGDKILSGEVRDSVSIEKQSRSQTQKLNFTKILDSL